MLLEQESLIASDALDRAEAAEAELLQLRHQLVRRSLALVLPLCIATFCNRLLQ